MLNRETLEKLAVGDTFEFGSPLDGVTQEPIKWKVLERSDSRVRLSADYLEVFIGTAVADWSGPKVTWAMEGR